MKIGLIIPCYNEEHSIENLINEIRSTNTNWDIIVVNDGSKDNTKNILKKLNVRMLDMPFNVGIGGAVQTGIIYCHEHGYNLGIQVDGDGQHPPDQISKLIEEYKKNKFNLVVGSRFLNANDNFRSTLLRRVAIKILSLWYFFLYRINIQDMTSGFRLMDREALHFFSQNYPHDYPEPMSLALAKNNGLRITEISVNMRARSAGVSSISGLKNILYMVRVMLMILLLRIERIYDSRTKN